MKFFSRDVSFVFTDDGQNIFSFQRWGYFLVSIILASFFANITYLVFDFPQQYSELIVGSVSWSYANKFHDYAVLFSFVGTFFIAILLLSRLSSALIRKLGCKSENDFHEFLILLCTPAGLWFTDLLTTKNNSLLLIELSALFIVVALIFVYLLISRSENFWIGDSLEIYRIFQLIFLVVIIAGFAVVAIGVGLNRISGLFNYKHFLVNSKLIYNWAAITLLVATTISAIYIKKCQALKTLEHHLKNAILLLQLTLPLFFLVLLPAPWLEGNALIIGYSLSPIAWALIVSCVLAAYIDLFKCIKASKAIIDKPLAYVSWICALGIILFLKTIPVGVPSISPDDYHFGEMLTPWWSWARHNMIPFWDYAPARGLINYFPGAVASFFLNGTVASFSAVWPFLYLLILLIAFPVFTKSMGKGPTIIALLLAPYVNGLSEIDILVTAFICVLCQQYSIKRPHVWIGYYITLSLTILLYAPGQGALAIMAVSPLACFMLYRLLLEQGVRQIIPLLILLMAILLMSIFSPLGKMIFGAIRYGVEQSSVNSIANGVSWSESFAKAESNPWLFEIMRASWILVALWAGAIIIKTYQEGLASVKSVQFIYSVPIFIITILFIIRAAGRIDIGPSRLGLASIWSLSLLLPLLLFSIKNGKHNGKSIFLWVSIAGLVYSYFGGSFENNPYKFYADRINPIIVSDTTLKSLNDADARFASIGRAITDPIHLESLEEIRKVLDKVLSSEETYLDLTGRGAHYFYLSRRQPIESGAIYNLVTEAQQLRAIRSLNTLRPPAILIEANNIYHDGGSASLRAYLLYRYLLLNLDYRVVQIGKYIWLIREDRINNLAELEVKSISLVNDSPDNLINNIFRVADLRLIPASWGRSFSSLSQTFHLINNITDSKLVTINSITRTGNGSFQPSGEDPFLRFDIQGLHIDGEDAGLLSFDFKCEINGSDPIIEVYWANEMFRENELMVSRFLGKDGVLIVPLDATPAWLLARKLKSIRIDIADKNSCKTFTINNIQLLQRNSISKMGEFNNEVSFP